MHGRDLGHPAANSCSLSKKTIFILLLLLCLVFSFWQGVRPPEYFVHPDELLYVYYAGLFKSFFITHNVDNIVWRSGLRYSAVPVGLYWIGLMLYLSPYRHKLAEPTKTYVFSGPNGMPHSVSKRYLDIQNHPLPYAKEMIYALRPRMLIFRAFCSVLLMLFAWYLGRYVCAAASTFLFLTNSMFLWYSSLVLLESIMIFEHFLNLLLIFLFISLWQNNKKSAKLWFLSALIGLTLGILAGTKISGGVNILIFVSLIFLLCMRDLLSRKLVMRDLFVLFTHLLVVIGVSFAVFVALNPVFFHANPFLVIREIVDARFACFASQAESFPNLSAPTVLSRLQFIIESGKMMGFTLVKSLLFLAGTVLLAAKACRDFLKEGRVGVHCVLLLSLFMQLLGRLFWMQENLFRYLVVLLPYMCLFMGYGFYCPVLLMLRLAGSRKNYEYCLKDQGIL